MIGRQRLYLPPDRLRRVMELFGYYPCTADFARICSAFGDFAEGLFVYLGARRTDSIDYSDFEGASVTHDMNRPLPEQLREQYSAVLDGGALEHIFNFPISIKNCMEMVRVGGHYLAITPANNFFGHGLYQFSPELYFSVLSEDNGFEVERMYAFEDVPEAAWYAVSSPRAVRGRVTLMNSCGVYLLIIARRVANRPIFERTPQQSDYVDRWEGVAESPGAPTAPAPRSLPIRLAKLVLPQSLRLLIRKAFTRPERPRLGFDPKFFQPFDPMPQRTASSER